MDEDAQVVGRANTVLVFNHKTAVISVIVVRGRKRPAGRKRLCFCGSVEFSLSVKTHIRKVILPIIDRISDTLGLARKTFEISAVNLGAASAMDVGVTVAGFSADLPIMLAMLSVALQVYISEDFVSTGHIASVDGDISAVEGIPAKLEAVLNAGTINHFIYGDLEKDKSLKVLSPQQRERSIAAIMAAQDPLRARAVSNIGQLVRLVFTEEGIVLASLREGFYGISQIEHQFSNHLQDVISFLTESNQKRFWDILDHHFLTGDCPQGKELLRALGQFYIGKQEYPSGFGVRLWQLICSIPPAIRKLQIDFPILNHDLCSDLIGFARDSDHDDRRILLNTVDGKNITDIYPINTQPEIKVSDFGGVAFDTVVAQINEHTLAQKFGAIDAARASFVLESSKVKSYEELINILQAYYIHLQRCSGFSPGKPEISEARSEAIKLLKSAFYNKGGDKAALVRARDGTEGGIRSVLDMLTEYYKAEKQDAYISRVFKDAIADMDWHQRVECMRAIIREVGRFLPEEIKKQPAERFARSDEIIETIIRTYVKCSDRFNQSLSSL